MNSQITLLELHDAIKDILYGNFEDRYWIVAEISQLNENKQGHCYLELIEKNDTDKTVAKAKANIWSFTFRHLKSYFEDMAGESLKAGMKVMILASVEFHELYGYSLNITDIDPTYTIGNQAQKRQEIIKQLEEDGVMDMNKEIEFALVPQKIAIISSETAAGFGDFMNQLSENTFNFQFYTKLFPAVMQGDTAEESIISALEQIYTYEDFFDVVVIIRGGGSKEELSCFDSYLLALNIAQYPIPILTGIGHERDESIADMVSHKKLKTPTAVAEFIIEQTARFDSKMEDFFMKIKKILENKLNEENLYLKNLSSDLKHQSKYLNSSNKSKLLMLEEISKNKMQKAFIYEKNKLKNIEFKILSFTRNSSIKELEKLVQLTRNIKNSKTFKLKLELNKLETINSGFPKIIQNFFSRNKEYQLSLNKQLTLLSPENVINRGYALVKKKNKIMISSLQIEKGDQLSVLMKDGEIDVVVS